MVKISKHKLKIIIVFASLFLTVAVLLLLIFLQGKKSYTVTFELDGGTLISGSLVQTVTRGQNASPPSVTKDGCYFLSWKGSYKQVTHDVTVEAVWEYETTPGITYSESENSNYTEIVGAYKYINGDVYIGAYHGGKKLLGIKQSAFAGCVDITKVYLLDGLITIEENAFEGCTGLLEIAIPETVTRIGDNAFLGCESLEKLVLNKGLLEIGDGTFEVCTALTEVTVPETVTRIGDNAFFGCESLEKLVLNEGLLEIGAGAFAGCSSLKEVIIPASVKSIDETAFVGCEDIKITYAQAEDAESEEVEKEEGSHEG